MKKFYTIQILFLFMSFCAIEATAQLEIGKVYNFKNLEYEMSMASLGVVKTVIADTDTSDKTQLWLVGDGGNGTYTLRNLGNGRYLKGRNANNGAWPFVDETDATGFYLLAAGDGYTLSMSNSSAGGDKMHYGSGNACVVGWSAGERASQWEIAEVSVTAEELETNWREVNKLETVSIASVIADYQKALDNLFTDKACTVLRKTYANLSAIENDTDYKALPSALQAMVKKVYNGNWDEDNAKSGKEGWDSKYAKKFRVQMYEPYSIAGGVTDFLGINTHANNDNPTGLYPHERGFVYVMVEGEIKSGATLRIVDAASDDRICDATQVGFELKAGLNMIPVYGKGGHLYICYNVETYNKDNKTFPNKLSDFEPLKIHIEGGSINGFYNACGDFRAKDDNEDLWKAATGASVDCDDDWKYYEERANLSVVPILGHRQIMLFQLEDTYDSDGVYQKGLRSLLPDRLNVPSTPNNRTGKWDDYGMDLNPSTHKVNILMEVWDRIMYSELASMGLVSEEAINRMNDLYPRWNSDGTRGEIYSYGETYRDFCEGRDYSEYFNHHGVALEITSGYMYGGNDHCGYNINTFGDIVSNIAVSAGATWGPGHEIGHQHQGVFTLGGQTEVTNNLFANIAVWYMGMKTSRVNGNEGALESVLAAYNTEDHDLYTNNIWALAHMYYRLWLYYHLAGNNTEFYPRLFELCRQQPLEKGGHLSGRASLLRFYQHACDAAGEDLTEFFRVHGYFEVMENRLVGDYGDYYYNVTQEEIDDAIASVKAKNYKENLAVILINDATSETTVKHDGKTARELWDNPTAEFGSVNDYISGNSVTAPYSAEVNSDGTMTMSGGEGAVGFLVLDNGGKVLSFSNKATFALSKEARYLLAIGRAKVVAVASDNKQVIAEYNSVHMQEDLFEALIAEVEALNIDDGTYRHVGFYTKPSMEKLLSALANAKNVVESGTGYAAAYKMLELEYESFLNVDNLITVPFDTSSTYEITNYAYPGQKMALNSSNEVKSLENPDADKAIWRFVPTGTAGIYNLQNTYNDFYLPAVVQSEQLEAVKAKASAANYVVQETDIAGVWTVGVTPHSDYTYLHSADANGDRVVGWSTDGAATKWYLTAVEDKSNSSFAAIDELQVLVSNVEALVNEVASVHMPKTLQYELQGNNPSAAYYISSNAGHNTADGNASGHTDGAGIAGLLDEDPATYFHSRWAGTAVNEAHYLQVDLGEGNGVESFVFEYETRKGSNSNQTSPAPTAIEVYAGNDIGNLGTKVVAAYTKDADNLPAYSDLGVSWMSQVITTGGTNRYLRFVVTGSQGPGTNQWNRQYFFAMGTFKLYNGDPVLGKWMPGFENMDFVKVKNALNAVVRAKEAVAAGKELAAAKSALSVAYETLLSDYQEIVSSRRTELQDLIDATKSVMDLVGGVTDSGDVIFNDGYAGCVSKEMLLAVYNEVMAAMAVKDAAISLTLLETQIEDLAAVKATLEEAIIQGVDRTELLEACSAAGKLYGMVEERRDYYTVSETVLSAIKVLEEKMSVADGVVKNNFSGQSAVDAACKELQAATAALQELVDGDVSDREELLALVASAEALVGEVAERDGTTFVLKDEYVSSPNMQVSLVETVCRELVIASALSGGYVEKENYDAALNRLQAAFDALAMAKALKNIPLVVTTDMDNPVVYKIGIKRGETKVLQYDFANTRMVSVEDYSEGNMLQGWYFTKGTTGDQLFIHPYLGGGDVLASNDVTDGQAKVEGLPKDSEGYMQEWILCGLEGGRFNIKPAEGSTWFSHHGGGYNKMGFYSYSNTTDIGSIFTFEPITFTGGVWENTLNAYIESCCTMENIVSGTTVGCYINGDDYNSARANAVTVLASDASESELKECYLALRAANEKVEFVPVTEGMYMIVSAKTEFNSNKVLSAHAKCGWNHTYHNPGWTTLDENDPLQYWTLEDNDDGTFNVKATYEGNYITSVSSMDDTPVATTFEFIGKEQFKITQGGGKPFHCNLHGWGVDASNIVEYDGGLDSPSAWRLVAVDEEPAFVHTLTVGNAGWSTLMLGFDAAIPEGVEAYVVGRVEKEYVSLAKVTGVLAANTPVVVKAAKGEYQFTYAADAATAISAMDCLKGTLYNKYIGEEAYVLSMQDGEVGFYKAALNKNSSGGEGGTHFLNNANKAYLVLPEASGVSFYSFRFGDDTTAIEEVVADEPHSTGIYDLTGRRVGDTAVKGIYIIDGKKVVK